MSKISKEEAQALLQEALLKTNKKILGVSFQLLDSIKHQLMYLIDALNQRNDRQKLCDINIGRYAAYEFDATDPEYANILYKAAEVSGLMIKHRL